MLFRSHTLLSPPLSPPLPHPGLHHHPLSSSSHTLSSSNSLSYSHHPSLTLTFTLRTPLPPSLTLFPFNTYTVKLQTPPPSLLSLSQDSTTKAITEANTVQQNSYHTSLSLESEVTRLQGQNLDLKDGFTKMRYAYLPILKSQLVSRSQTIVNCLLYSPLRGAL